MNRNNHEDNTNKARHNIHEYAQKNSEKYIKKIDEMRSSKERMTFKNSGKYLWSLIVLGINWMVYKKVLIVLLTAIILVGALVWSPPIGLILCLLMLNKIKHYLVVMLLDVILQMLMLILLKVKIT